VSWDQSIKNTLVSITVSTIQLPILPVPHFSENFSHWPSFYDSFTQLIHENPSLSNIPKFHFLKQGLPDGRDQDITHMALTETNYLVAWNHVVKRYNNPRLQFMYNMDALYGIEPLSKEIAVDLRNLLNLANVCISEFRRLHIAIDSCDHRLVHHLLTKLPISTTQVWKHSLGNNVEIPTFTKLEVFLHNRLLSIDLIESRKLPFQLDLHLYNRPTIAREPDHQETLLLCSKACINCISSSHSFSQFSSNQNCSKCGQRHHTLLHFPNAQQSSSLTPGISRQNVVCSERRRYTKCTTDATLKRSCLPSELNHPSCYCTGSDPK